MRYLIQLLLLLPLSICAKNQIKTDVIIIGGGASGTMAAIQAARLGVKTVVLEETVRLGGMLTSAGVSAIDGNHKMPSGLWGEFRAQLYEHYGGAKVVETGWVSNTLFEPSVGNAILQKLVKKEKNIEVFFESRWTDLVRLKTGWKVIFSTKGGKETTVEGAVLIDAKELGDASGEALTIGRFQEIMQVLQNGITIPEIQSVFDRNGIDLTATFSLQLNRRTTAILLQDVLHVFEQGLDYQGELIN